MWLTLQCFLDVLAQSIVDGEPTREASFVGEAHCGEPVGNRTQAHTFGRCLLFSLDVCGTDDEAQPVKNGISNGIVLRDCLKRTT